LEYLERIEGALKNNTIGRLFKLRKSQITDIEETLYVLFAPFACFIILDG